MFTAKAVQSAKQPGRYTDSAHKGLSLNVSKVGNRTWQLRYYSEGKERRIKLCGDIPLADVLQIYHDTMQQRGAGADPAALREEERQKRALQQDLAEIARSWQAATSSNRAEKTNTSYQYNLDNHILPYLGKLALEDLKKTTLAQWQNKISVKNGPRSATLSLAILRSMLTWCVDQGMLEYNVASTVKPVVKHKPKKRYLKQAEIKTFWNWLESMTRKEHDTRQKLHVYPAVVNGLKLILLTGCRPGEVAGIHAREIEGDWWTIPGSRTKNGEDHRVYLSPTAKSLLLSKTGYLLPSPRKVGAAVTGASFTRTLNRYRQTLQEMGVEPFCPHDLRRTAATHLARIGFSGLVPDLLNHSPQGVTRLVYDQHSRDPEKQRALLKWERELQQIIRTDEEQQKVVNLKTYKG